MTYLIIIIGLLVFLIFIGKITQKNESINFETKNILPSNHSISNEITKDVPKGYKLVKRKTAEWNELGFTDGSFFPGYGEIYIRTFDTWNHTIGKKDNSEITQFKDKATEYNIPLKEINGYFDQNYSRKKGYIRLFTYIDVTENKRYYYGLKHLQPTCIITASAT